jgi:hypothetical protein
MAYDDLYADDPFSDRRQRLIAALRQAGGLGGGRAGGLLRGGRPMIGGLGRGTHSSFDLPFAALPQVSFDPFAAQQALGIPNLSAPSQVDDLQGVGGGRSGLGGGAAPQGLGGPVGAPAPAPASFFGVTQRAAQADAPRRFLGGAEDLTTPDPNRPLWLLPTTGSGLRRGF